MKKILISAIIIIAVALIALNLKNPKTNGEISGKLNLAATIFPLYDILREVAGDSADIKLLLPPGASPHVFEPSPRQLAELQNTQIIFSIGHGLDAWTAHIQNIVPDVKLVTADKNINLRTNEEEEDHEEEERDHAHGPIDPHYWLNFQNASIIADTIARELSEIDPSRRDGYFTRALSYKEKLAAKEQELKSALADVPASPILTFHDGWFYFAENFNLEIAGEFEPSVAEEPSPRYLAELGRAVKEKNIRVIFFEPQFSPEQIRAFADENNLSIAELDPIGGIPGRESFLELMEFNTNSVVSAFGGEKE